MPFSTIKLLPGVKAELTPTLNEAGISSSNLIRFFNGLPQKIGGWIPYYQGVLASTPRALAAWEDLNGAFHLAIGCDTDVFVVTAGIVQDIAPQTTTTNQPVNFSTTATSDVVTIRDVGSNASIYDAIVISTPVSIGGIILYGAYQIAAVIDANTYQIDAATPATGTVAGGGAVPSYTTVAGSFSVSVTLANHGYSVGSTFAAPISTLVGGITIEGLLPVATVTNANVFVINFPTQATSSATASMNGGLGRITYWLAPQQPGRGSGTGAAHFSMFNWGSTLILCPTGYGIFAWSPNSGVGGSQLIPNAPTANTGAFLAMPEQQIVVYGAAVLGILDPMLVAWCDAGDYNVWTAAVSNQAGTFRLTRGSRIVGGLQGPQQALLWTDVGLWVMQYIGYPLVYGFNEVAQGCGLIAKEAAGVLGASVFWMSQKGFFSYSNGAVTPIPCDVWDAIFQDLNPGYISKIVAAPNSYFNEISWYFVSNSVAGTENNRYVKYNVALGVWDYGTLSRSCWIDQNVLGPPLAGGPGGTDFNSDFNSDFGGGSAILQHETGPDAINVPIDSWFQTGYFMLSDGEDFVFVDRVYPDFKYSLFGPRGDDFNSDFNSDFGPTAVAAPVSATLQMTFFVTDDQAKTPRQYGPFFVSAQSGEFGVRFRGRFIATKIESFDLGSFWRMAAVKFRYAPDGRN